MILKTGAKNMLVKCCYRSSFAALNANHNPLTSAGSSRICLLVHAGLMEHESPLVILQVVAI